MVKQLLRLMTELSSHRWLSRLMGALSHSRLSRLMIPVFIRSYQIPAAEAEKAAGEYRTLNEFFSRRLKPGMRPVASGEHAVASPVDAMITAMGEINCGTIMNVKGQDYTLEDLLNHSPHLELYKKGYYFVLYLSPTDYHRIHSPLTGQLRESDYIRGRAYPVNDFGMRHMKSVLSRNERLITYIAGSYGETAVVKVGAMNVSSIRYTDEAAREWQRGDDLAYFEFGSTVVLLMESGTFTPRPGLAPDTKVKMGELLGEMRRPV
ncbi:phosphatidylserine decarboxylase [Paenibacillus sp. FSL R7-277]|uniref:Phosphatidylserine decarboxylase proenzyme n=1 Tax=Paenibacillus silagei TaxID=1670801 RepID=A0ABS4NUP6_9BACL|nr:MULTISPECIES: archaetidylserine decarboxylase [Paenibacillus]ETT68256.1 phosphatidylserine decarboxylase [Paenibacillus sp. FSL R7-277]MBP2113790.1 phosphatidylserine decarboxylase [Paenibacillus silagei]OMF88151.1 phosphatidylserine decarboxylase [Paenibacillus sp. FSL R7-0333]